MGLFLSTILAFGSFADLVLVALCDVAGLGMDLYLEDRVDIHGILDRRGK